MQKPGAAKLATIAIVTWVSFANLAHVDAFPDGFMSFRWPTAEVTFNINPADFTPGTPFHNAILSGLGSWLFANVPGSSFTISYWASPVQLDPSDHFDGENTIGWTDLGAVCCIAVTTHRFVGSEWIEVDMQINNNPSVTWVADESLADPVPPYDNFNLEGVVRHEAGHAVGLKPHEDRSPRVAVLGSVYSYGAVEDWWMHGDDRNGIRTLYPGAGIETDITIIGWKKESSGMIEASPVAAPAPSVVDPGDNVSIEFTIENLGTQTALNVPMGIYLSSNVTITTSDRKIANATLTLNGATGGNTVVPISTVNGVVSIPPDVVPGTYYLGVIVDDTNVLAESRESNNALVLPYSQNPKPITVQEPCTPMCSVSPTELAFDVATIGGSDSKTFAVTNTGCGTLTGSVSAPCAEFSVSPSSYSLAAGQSTTFTVSYTPTNCGDDNCTIDTGVGCSNVTASATGPAVPVCSVSPTELAFDVATIGGSDTTTFSITNTGCGTLSGGVSAPCVEFSVSPSSYSLAAGLSTIFTVIYTPVDFGNDNCTLNTGVGCSTVTASTTGPSLFADEPVILSVMDIANDQGRRVRLAWERSRYDAPGAVVRISGYNIYRRQDEFLSAGEEGSVTKTTTPAPKPAPKRGALLDGWDYVATVPSSGDSAYAYNSPTLCDSTSAGVCWSTFFVSAVTSDPLTYYDSQADSGYSVDNLAPPVPQGFVVTYNTGIGNQLSWSPVTVSDFYAFKVYRGRFDPNFVVHPDSLVHLTGSTSWTDPDFDGGPVYYLITASDFSGNESDAAEPGTVTSVGNGRRPLTFALYQNTPNPFNPMTWIQYDVPNAGVHVVLQIFDVNGQHIRMLVDGVQSAGRNRVTWDGRDDHGGGVATGIYFYQLRAGGFKQARKMLLIK